MIVFRRLAIVFRALILICLASSPTCAADSVGIEGSMLGFIFDPANGLQPILGITGASTIGPPLDLQTRLASAAISPRQDYALARTTPGANLLQVTLTGSYSIGQLSFPVHATDLMALSPSGSAAALYDNKRSCIRVISGLPGGPFLARDVDLSAFSGTPTTLAISDAADAILAGFSNEVVGLGSDGTIRNFTTFQHATAAAFMINSPNILIADGGANSVYLVTDILGSTDPVLLASDQDGILAPVAIGVSNDNKKIVVALAGGVATISLVDGSVALTGCPCQPTGLASLKGNAVFRLTEPSGGPLWLFDGDAPDARIVFVPPYQSSAQTRPQ